MIRDIWIKKIINQNITKSFFKYYECGILGCGRNSQPWVDLSRFVLFPSNVLDIKQEVEFLLSRAENKSGIVSSLIPKELNDGKHLLTHYLNHIDSYIDKETIESFKTSDELDQYIYKHHAEPIWNTNLVLRKHATDYWNKKHTDECEWVPFKGHYLKEWIESLRSSVFKQIGRVVIFNNKVNSPVFIHRDAPYRPHNNHFINIQLSDEKRPVFVYDEITKEKIYMDSKVYMFNEVDLHGVDAESTTNFTLRIDGTFHDHICKEIDLPLGRVWDYTFASGKKVNNINVYEDIDD